MDGDHHIGLSLSIDADITIFIMKISQVEAHIIVNAVIAKTGQ